MNKPAQTPQEPHDTRRPSVKQGDPAGALEADLKRQEAIKLRLKGWTFERIGEELGVSGKTAHEYVHDGWDRINHLCDKARGELRDLINAQLGVAMQTIMAVLCTENLVVIKDDGKGGEVREDGAKLKLQAIDKLVKVHAVQAKLYGLNAPEKIEVSGSKRTLEPLHLLAARVHESMKNQAAIGQPGDARS